LKVHYGDAPCGVGSGGLTREAVAECTALSTCHLLLEGNDAQMLLSKAVRMCDPKEAQWQVVKFIAEWKNGTLVAQARTAKQKWCSYVETAHVQSWI